MPIIEVQGLTKTYRVLAKGLLAEADLDRLREGVELTRGLGKSAPAKVRLLGHRIATSDLDRLFSARRLERRVAGTAKSACDDRTRLHVAVHGQYSGAAFGLVGLAGGVEQGGELPQVGGGHVAELPGVAVPQRAGDPGD